MTGWTITQLLPSYAQALEDFIALPDNAGEDYRLLARKYIQMGFSSRRYEQDTKVRVTTKTDYTNPIFVIAVDQKFSILGCAAIVPALFAPSFWGICFVNVLKTERNKGLGQALTEECITFIKDIEGGKATVMLATLPGKSRLYEKSGFTKAGLDHDGGWLMTRILD